MTTDLFQNSLTSPINWGLIALLVVAYFVGGIFEKILWIFFFFGMGITCVWNYRRCKRIHCQITGYGFLVVTVIALANVLGYSTIHWKYIWSLFFLFLIFGYGYEFYKKHKTGTAYKKK